MPENPNETKLVNFAMANGTRWKIINFLANGCKSTGKIGEIIGKATLDFHLKILQKAGLIELEEGIVKLRTRHKIIQLIHHILWFECVIPFSVKLIMYNT